MKTNEHGGNRKLQGIERYKVVGKPEAITGI